MSFLDLLVDGEVVREAMLVDNSDGEEIMYKGPNLEKRIKNVSFMIIDNLPAVRYLVISMPRKKYVVISVSQSKYLVLGINPKVNSEQFVEQITKSLKELGLEWEE
ncbi:MAG: hypothetical protein QFX35_04425 [Candidatus Verstraetearchaeota archaeon]|nr:hypothetical protein [Candidatus Verstraetearchaeota archaeon]